MYDVETCDLSPLLWSLFCLLLISLIYYKELKSYTFVPSSCFYQTFCSAQRCLTFLYWIYVCIQCSFSEEKFFFCAFTFRIFHYFFRQFFLFYSIVFCAFNFIIFISVYSVERWKTREKHEEKFIFCLE